MIARRPRPRVGLLGPVLLIGAGVVALLVTTGQIGSDWAGRLLPLWPLLLVLVGVQIVVLELLPGRAGALVALVAMLVVVTFGAGLALAVPGAPAATFRSTAPAAGVAAGSLRLDAGPGAVRLTGQDLAGDLYRADITTAASGGPGVQAAGGSVHLASRSPGDAVWLRRGASDDVAVALTSQVPWTVTVNGAGLTGQADLSALDLSGVALNGAFLTFDLRLGAAPRGAVTIAVNGVGTDVAVRIPQGTSVHAVVTGVATGLDVNRTGVNGGAWTSPGFDAAAGHYEIRAAGVGSRVRLETMP